MSNIDYTALINDNGGFDEETSSVMAMRAAPIAESWSPMSGHDTYTSNGRQLFDEDVSEVNKKKVIDLGKNQVNLTQEKFSQFIPFTMDRYQDGIDFSNAAIAINYTRPGETNVIKVPAVNAEYSTSKIRFGWLVDDYVTEKEGALKFGIEITGSIMVTNKNGNTSYQAYTWKSQTNEDLKIIKSLGTGSEITLDEGWQDKVIASVAAAVSTEFTKHNYYNKSEVDNLIETEIGERVEPFLTTYVTNGNLSVDDSNYKVTLTLTTAGGDITSTIDLPLESVVVDGEYREVTEGEEDEIGKFIDLTLQNGKVITIPVDGIVSGLASTDDVTAAIDELNKQITEAFNLFKEETNKSIETLDEKIGELGDYDTAVDYVEGRLGALEREEGVQLTVKQYVDSIDISGRLGDLGKAEDGETDKTVEQFVNDKLGNLNGKTVETYVTDAVTSVDVTEQLDELSAEFDKKLDIGEAESVAKYVETYVDSKIGDIDLEEQLKSYVTETELREEIGELVSEDGEKMSVQEYIAAQLDSNVSSNYYKATYGKTEIEGVEQDNIFTLWKADEDFDPEQPGEIQVTAVSQFQITGGGGSGATLNKLYLYREADKKGNPIKKYTYRVEDVESSKAILKYSFNGVQAANNQPVDDVTGVWEYRRGTTGDWKTINTFSLEITPEDTLAEFNASQYLKENDTYQFKLKASDDSGASTSLTWTVTRIYFAIDLDFDDNKGYPIKDTYLNYTPWGVGIEKTIHFKFSNLEEKTTKTLYSGTSASWLIPISEIYEPLQHGSHLLEVWMTAEVNGVEISSEHQYKDIIFYSANRTVPIVGIAPRSYEVEQYSSTNIEFTVYDPNTTKPKIYIQEEFNGVSGELQERTLEEMTDYYTFKAELPGEHKITFTAYDPTGEFSNTHTIIVNVAKFPYEIAPIIGAVIDFNPVGKNNSEITLNEDGTATAWTNEVYTLNTSSNFDWTNGGYQSDYDKNGKPISGTEHFLIKAGTRAELSYKFFGGDGDGIDPTEAGRDFKLIFKTQRVEKSNAQFLSCLSEATGQKIGLEMNVHEAYIHGGTNSLHLPYSEEDVIEFGFKLPKKVEGKTGAVTGYEDGVSTSVMLDKGLSFVQKAGERQNITLGSDDCDLLVYRLKIYENELTDSQILTNFIADARTGEEMKSRHERNQIYDDAGKLTPKALAEKCPWLRVVTITAPTFTTGKDSSQAVLGSTIEYRYGNGEKEGTYSYWRCEDAVHVGQGTSSNLYGASGRNIDLVLKEYKDKGNNPIIYLNEPDEDPIVLESGKVALSKTSIPNNYFNVKVNVASSENANNALLQKRFNEYEIFKRPFTDEQCITVEGKRVTPKDTMEFFNCVIFITETADSGHTEFEDKECHFYAIGNIGDSKKTDKTRLTDKRDDYECCLEIMDVRLPLSDFPRDTIVEAMQYELDSDGNKKYLFATQKNLDDGKLLIKNTNTGEYETATGTIDVEKVTYYIDGKAVEDFSEDFTYGWRYIKEYDPEDFKTDENTDEQAEAAADAKNKEIADYCAARWWELYDFITKSTDEEFHDNFEDYFVLDSALYYYLFTTRYTMVDNRAKNSFWHYGKVGVDGEGNPIRRWDLNWGYDMDTALGTDNDGDMVYRYGYEDTDMDEKGVEIFRESDSTFFCRLRDLFATELATKYADNHAAWNAQDLIDKFDNWQAQFPEELWRLDIQRKYIRPATGPIDNSVDKGVDEKYLDNMANGRKKYQRRQFERNQELYMASKYRAPAATGSNQIILRCANVENDNSTLVVPQSFNITLTPFTYMYLNVKQASGMKKVRVTELFNEDGSSKTYPFEFTGGTDFVEIDSAKWIQSLGDISAMYPSSVSAPTAEKLKELIIGSDRKKVFDDGSELSYYNKHLGTLTTGANELLEVLNIRNVGYNQVLDLSSLENLREVYAKGAAITGVICADGGELQTAEMPAITSITMNNLVELNTLTLDGYDKLTTLNVNNCPKIDWIEVINKSTNLYNVRLTGISWELSNTNGVATALLERIYNMSDYNGVGKAVLEGRIKVDIIDLKDYEKFTERWKGLTIDAATKVPYYVVTFKNEETGETYLTQNVTQGKQVVKPDFIPVKTSTPQYDYVFRYWRLEGKTGEYSYSNPVTGPLTLVPYFEKIVRKYTVQYVDHNNNVLQETKNVDYGAYISYSGEVPVNTIQEPIGIYRLFKGWDQSGYVHPTSVETATIVIKPVFEEFNWTTVDVDNLNLKELSNNAAAIYALTKQISEVEGMRDKVSSQFSDYTTDDVITLQMGEDFATWSDVITYDYLANGIGKIYDGTDGARSAESLFKEDKDFTFVLDYTLKNAINETGKNNIYTICSNYTNNLGFKLYCDGSGKQKLDYSVKKDGVTEQRTITLATAAMKYNSNKQPDNFLREVLVFAHKKGTSTIECYFSNKQPATGEVPEVFYQQLDFGEFPNIAIDLAFGGEISGLLYNNKATGVLHWVKKFDAYLDEVECNKLAAWTRETVQFFPCFNSGKEPLNLPISGGQSGETTSLVFMSTHLLDMLGSVYGDSTSLWGDEGSRSRLYLNNRWFNGVSPLWRQLIKPVLVTSQRSDSAQSTESKVFIPAIRNLASTMGYANEGETISLFADLDNNRKAYFADGTGPAPYWTRSRQGGSGHNTYYINESGSVVYTNDPEYLNAYYRIMIGM